MEVSPICSASLKSISGLCIVTGPTFPPAPVTLTFLPGCTQPRDVHVQFYHMLREGASVKIRCHCHSQGCIVPFEGHADLISDAPWRWRAGLEEVGVRFLPTPAGASPQDVQPYTVLFTWHTPGPEEAPEWGHVIMPSVL